MELLHLSKAGGTSMCQLAAAAGLANPAFSIARNCLVSGFDDGPRWSRVEDFMRPLNVPFWPAVDCPKWKEGSDAVTCSARASHLLAQGINFYANELTLHGGNGTLGSAAACPEFETVVVLREPVERKSYLAASPKFERNQNLVSWQGWAPAVLDNYMTRSLLGRHYLCRNFGNLGPSELLAAARTLTSLDHVLVLEEGNLNDVVMRAGMGWSESLRNKRWRWALAQGLHKDLGFAPNATQLLKEWNALDAQLYTWGQLMLRLDASFHTAVAAMTGRVHCQGQEPPAALVDRAPHAVARSQSSRLTAGDSKQAAVAEANEARVLQELQAQPKFSIFGYVFVQDRPAGAVSEAAPADLPLHLDLLPAGLQQNADVIGAIQAAASHSACHGGGDGEGGSDGPLGAGQGGVDGGAAGVGGGERGAGADNGAVVHRSKGFQLPLYTRR